MKTKQNHGVNKNNQALHRSQLDNKEQVYVSKSQAAKCIPVEEREFLKEKRKKLSLFSFCYQENFFFPFIIQQSGPLSDSNLTRRRTNVLISCLYFWTFLLFEI